MLSVFCDKYQYWLYNSDKGDYINVIETVGSPRNEITLRSLYSLKQSTRETITLKR